MCDLAEVCCAEAGLLPGLEAGAGAPQALVVPREEEGVGLVLDMGQVTRIKLALHWVNNVIIEVVDISACLPCTRTRGSPPRAARWPCP